MEFFDAIFFSSIGSLAITIIFTILEYDKIGGNFVFFQSTRYWKSIFQFVFHHHIIIIEINKEHFSNINYLPNHGNYLPRAHNSPLNLFKRNTSHISEYLSH